MLQLKSYTNSIIWVDVKHHPGVYDKFFIGLASNVGQLLHTQSIANSLTFSFLGT